MRYIVKNALFGIFYIIIFTAVEDVLSREVIPDKTNKCFKEECEEVKPEQRIAPECEL